jgi:tryptophan aminotransferase
VLVLCLAALTRIHTSVSLRLAKEYNLLIMEDDAYAFLYYGDEAKARSYFALEPEVNQEVGRVLRFDSFSKILSSGMRLGFATAHKDILDRMDLITANTKYVALASSCWPTEP